MLLAGIGFSLEEECRSLETLHVSKIEFDNSWGSMLHTTVI